MELLWLGPPTPQVANSMQEVVSRCDGGGVSDLWLVWLVRTFAAKERRGGAGGGCVGTWGGGGSVRGWWRGGVWREM